MSTPKSKFRGCLLGVALGDALGRPFEGAGAVEPEEVERFAETGRLTYTDDTHMTIGVAESLIACGGFDAKHMLRTLAQNYEREPFRGYGPGPPAIFAMLRGVEEWEGLDRRLYPGGSFGNGSAMRVAPVGLLYHEHPQTLRRIACESSRLTHSHPLGVEAAALQAYAVARAVGAKGLRPETPDEFLERLMDFCAQPEYREKLRRVSGLLRAKAERAGVISMLGHGVEALNSLPAALYAVLAHWGSFEETVKYAASLGGDSDTIASMAGAVAGALHGSEALPPAWLERLENRDYLERLASGLWDTYRALSSKASR